MKQLSFIEAINSPDETPLIYKYAFVERFESSQYQRKTEAHSIINLENLTQFEDAYTLSEGVGNLLEDENGNIVFDSTNEIIEDESFELVSKFTYRGSGLLKKLKHDYQENITNYDEDEDETQIFDWLEIDASHYAFEEFATKLGVPLETLEQEEFIIEGLLDEINTNTLLWYSFNDLESVGHYSLEIFSEF